MTQIQIIGLKRNTSYTEIGYKMSFTLPAIYGTGALPIKGLSIIITSFPDGFSTEMISPDGTVITFSETVSLSNPSMTIAQIKNQLLNKYTQIRTKLDSLTLTPYDTIAGLSYDGTNWT